MSRKHSKKKINNYDYKKAFKRKSDLSFRKKAGMAFVAANLLIAPAAGTYLGENLGQSNVAEAASLAEVQLLSDVNINADLQDSGNPDFYNLNLQLTGTGLADLELVNPDRSVVFYAEELAGQLSNNGPADVTVEILPIVLEEDLPALSNSIAGVTGSVNDLVAGLTTTLDNTINGTSLAGLVQVEGLDELGTALESLNNLDAALQDLTQYNGQAEVVINGDGSVVVTFEDGLGNHVEAAVENVVQSALNDVLTAVDNVNVTLLDSSPLLSGILETLVINPIVNPLVSGVTSTVNGLQQDLTSGAIDISNELAGVQVVGNTTVNANVLVNRPAGIEGDVVVQGAGITTSVIDAELLSSLQSSDVITFDEDATAPVLDSADITGNSTDGYAVTGTGAEPGDDVIVSDADGNQIGTSIIAEDGTYAVDVAADAVVPGEVLTVQAIDDAGNVSEPLPVTVPEDVDDVVPVLDSADITGNSTDGYAVTGTGAEPGDDVVVSDADGNQVGTGIIAEDGT
ncbi:hypothetical protein GQ671_07470, partial [Salinicoccus hispanicus]